MPDVIIDLQNENISLREQVANLTGQLDTATLSNAELSQRVTDLQEHNQKLFLQITQEVKKEEPEDNNEAVSLEEFASTLNI